MKPYTFVEFNFDIRDLTGRRAVYIADSPKQAVQLCLAAQNNPKACISLLDWMVYSHGHPSRGGKTWCMVDEHGRQCRGFCRSHPKLKRDGRERCDIPRPSCPPDWLATERTDRSISPPLRKSHPRKPQ